MRLRFSMLSLLMSLIVRLVIPVSPLSWKTGMGNRNKNHNSGWNNCYYYTPHGMTEFHGNGWDSSELVDMIAQTLSIIYQQSWSIRKVPDNWRLASVMPFHSKGRKSIQETTGLSDWPWYQGRSWIRSPWSCTMCRNSRQLVLSNMGSWKADSGWPAWSTTARWPS